MILRCTCKHEYQDKKYGFGMRVHNPTKEGLQFRCTVCDTVRSKGEKPVAKKSEEKTS